MAFTFTNKETSSGAFALDNCTRAFLDIHFGKEDVLTGKKSSGISMLYSRKASFKPLRMAQGAAFIEQAMETTFFPNVNYYITANSFKRCNPRDTGNLFGLHNIVIDCDLHDDKHLASYFMDGCKYFKEDIMEYFRTFAPDIPEPNSIVFSGRGLQFWWAFLPVRMEYADCYEFLQDVFIEIIKSFISDNPQYSDYSVDEGASRNKAGLFRLPGTFNTKVNTKTYVYLLDDTVHDMFALRKALSQTRDPIRRMRYGMPSYADDSMNANSFAGYAQKRATAIATLVEVRGRKVNGYRDFILWLYHNECSKFMDEEKAFEQMIELNKKFSHPLQKNKLKHVVSSTLKRGNIYDDNGGYAIRNSTIIDILNITREEQEIIDLHPAEIRVGSSWGTPNKTRDAKNREKKRLKRLRELTIIKRIRNGLSMKEAAKFFHLCYDTIRRIVRDWKAGKYNDLLSVTDQVTSEREEAAASAAPPQPTTVNHPLDTADSGNTNTIAQSDNLRLSNQKVELQSPVVLSAISSVPQRETGLVLTFLEHSKNRKNVPLNALYPT